MAYSTSNPPMLMAGGPLTGAGRRWSYRSTDPAGTVDDTDYFSNGVALGMLVGDIVEMCDTDTSTTMSFHRVTALSTAGATVSAGLVIT